ncbi:hypothetical protein C9374_008802 [Naegleria lovaniensis]|uniref:Uncharacterized protein n=1 Tax=Naegleria lovaniensis TaxID=51637 RepID=A0AA88GHZ9_NAELO|nr:uncharacterized protein C9374_008802 [Naegleria lovaniensis]KAG2377717.1 hypothetical protein C9374_008802 [Naegleria lovaniensis]
MSQSPLLPPVKEHMQMRVCPRFRPFLKTDEECKNGEDKPKTSVAFHKNGKNFLIKNGLSEPLEFTFDKFLKSTATQDETFTSTYGPEVLQRVIDGFNCTIFSYGAQHTGKSFTLFGKSVVAANHHAGFAVRLTRSLFDFIVHKSPPEIEFSVSLTAFETHGNENGDTIMTDLLIGENERRSSHLEVLVNDETSTVEVTGLHEEFVTSENEFFQSVNKALEKASREPSTVFIEIKVLQSDPATKITKESRRWMLHITTNGEAIHAETDDFDYFATTLRCLLFSRIFVNSICYAFITLSPSAISSVITKYTIPSLQLASKLNELSSEVAPNLIRIDDEERKKALEQSKNEENQPSTTTSPQTSTHAPETPSSPRESIILEETEQYKKLLAERNSLQDDVSSLKIQVETLKAQLSKEDEKNSHSRKQLVQLENALNETTKQLKEVSLLKDSLQKEKERFQEVLSQSHQEIQTLKQKLIEEESKREEMGDKIAEVEDLKKTIQKLQTQLSSSSSSESPLFTQKKEETNMEALSVAKIQYDEMKQLYYELLDKVDELEKKNIELEEEKIATESKAIPVDDPSNSLIEKLKNKNRVLMEQLNSAKRENIKTREKSSESVLKSLDVKLDEFRNIVTQYKETAQKQILATMSTYEETSQQDKATIQKLKLNVTDLTNKLNTARKKNTEMEISRMKWQEGEKYAKQRVVTLEKELEELKLKSNEKEKLLSDELEKLKVEVITAKDTEILTLKDEISRMEKENGEIIYKLKKAKANRKKTVAALQQAQEQHALLLLQEKERNETLEREIKFLKKYTGVKMDTFSKKNDDSVTQPKKLNTISAASSRQKEMLAKRLSVTINKTQSNKCNDLRGTPLSRENSKTSIVSTEEEEYDAKSPRYKKLTSSNNNLNDIQGYLEKRSPKLNLYKRRYFRLDGSFLFYYVDDVESKPIGSIDLKTATIELSPEKSGKKRFVFKVEIPAKPYYLSCSTAEEREVWFNAISNIIKISKN